MLWHFFSAASAVCVERDLLTTSSGGPRFGGCREFKTRVQEMINFDLTEEQRLLEQSVREWAAREVAPRIHDLDREHRFDTKVLPLMASLGLLGISVPEEYGGAG